jgi:CRP-like cAMP-binding protein
MDAETIIAWLNDAPAFRGAPDAALSELAAAFTERPITANETVVRQGDAGGEFFLLANGNLTITGTKDGEARNYGTIGAGETFGEIASLTGGERLATVTAQQSGLLLVLARSDFQAILHRHPTLAETVLLSLERYLE